MVAANLEAQIHFNRCLQERLSEEQELSRLHEQQRIQQEQQATEIAKVARAAEQNRMMKRLPWKRPSKEKIRIAQHKRQLAEETCLNQNA